MRLLRIFLAIKIALALYGFYMQNDRLSANFLLYLLQFIYHQFKIIAIVIAVIDKAEPLKNGLVPPLFGVLFAVRSQFFQILVH